MGNKGIDSIKAVLLLMFGLQKAYKDAMADGKIDLADLPVIMGLLPQIEGMASHFNDVIPELKDLSAEEGADLVAFAMAHLAITDAHASDVVDKSLKLALAALELAKAIKAPASPSAPAA